MATHSGFLPGESHDRGALWATVYGVTKELDTTERLKQPTNHTLSKLEPHSRRFLETSAYLFIYLFIYFLSFFFFLLVGG